LDIYPSLLQIVDVRTPIICLFEYGKTLKKLSEIPYTGNQSLINLNFQSATCSSSFSMYLTEAFFLGSICTESTVPLVFSIFNLDVYLD
jgi:hypothetical protein